MAKLRSENERLTQRSTADSAILEAYFLKGLPRSQEEFREMVVNARPFREMWEELKKKHDVGQ